MLSKIVYKLRIKIDSLLDKVGLSDRQEIADGFHKLFYDTGVSGGTWAESKFLGVPVQKYPSDLMVFQEIVYEVKPDIIVEAGTAFGGTTLFLAGLCDLMDHGEIVSIDIEKHGNPPLHKRVTYLIGSSTDDAIVAEVKKRVAGKSTVLIILDSAHTRDHVFKELGLYNDLVTLGSYLIVEDTNVNGHPVYPGFGPGPMEALEEFLSHDDKFEYQSQWEKYLVTFNPKGYLKRVK